METLKVATILGFAAGLLGLLGLGLAGVGTRLGLWDFRTGFAVLRYAAYTGLAGAVLALLCLPFARGALLVMALAGVAAGALAGWLPWQWSQKAARLPVIHDITTDTENPPPFKAILAIRQYAPNPAQYGGPEVADQQRKGYPNLGPATFRETPGQVYAKALGCAKALGWEIVAESPESGIIEATDTTFWFGFKDDIVVRVAAVDGGTRVDVRSVSRVGRSDVGTNAARIAKYLERLEK